MKTKDNIHNLHMKDMKFFAPKWKGVIGRQIVFDTEYPDTYFVLKPKTLELFVYFEPFGTKANPRIIKITKLSGEYISDVYKIAMIEVRMLTLFKLASYQALKELNTTAKLEKALKS